MKVTATIARLVNEGDVLTDAEGKHTRVVIERDDVSNVHGKIIFRTGRAGKGTTLADPDTILHIAI